MDLFSTLTHLNAASSRDIKAEPTRAAKPESLPETREDFKSVLNQVRDEKSTQKKENTDKKISAEELQQKLEKLEEKIESLKSKAGPEQKKELEQLQDFLKQVKELLARLKDSKLDASLQKEGLQIDLFQMITRLMQEISQVLDNPQGMKNLLQKLEGLEKKLDSLQEKISQPQIKPEEVRAIIDNTVKHVEQPREHTSENKVKVIDSRSSRHENSHQSGSQTLNRMEKNEATPSLFRQELQGMDKAALKDQALQSALAETQQTRLQTTEVARVQYSSYASSVSRVHLESLMQGIAGRAVVTLSEGRSEVSMKLTPPELGNLNIKFSLEDGKMIGKIVVSTQEAKMLFDQNLWDLQRSLQNAGIDVQSMDVNVSQQGQDETEPELFSSRESGSTLSLEEISESPLRLSGLYWDNSVNYIA